MTAVEGAVLAVPVFVAGLWAWLAIVNAWRFRAARKVGDEYVKNRRLSRETSR